MAFVEIRQFVSDFVGVFGFGAAGGLDFDFGRVGLGWERDYFGSGTEGDSEGECDCHGGCDDEQKYSDIDWFRLFWFRHLDCVVLCDDSVMIVICDVKI